VHPGVLGAARLRRTGRSADRGGRRRVLPRRRRASDLLRGGTAALARVPARRATYAQYKALPPYPALIVGHFDPVRWAADPQRRTDLIDARGGTVPTSDTVSGFPVAPGAVEGVARVIADPEQGERLQPGDIWVTTVTNVGWTPLFPRAAAVVTDLGAPLSHASIVARELGIPAVGGTRQRDHAAARGRPPPRRR
jgi:phosphohistidine swiveling domain-containing protein